MSLMDGANGRRFIATGPFDDEMPQHYVVIADIKWWIANEKEVYVWMDSNLPRKRLHHTGMVLELDNEQDAFAFILRWA